MGLNNHVKPEHPWPRSEKPLPPFVRTDHKGIEKEGVVR